MPSARDNLLVIVIAIILALTLVGMVVALEFRSHWRRQKKLSQRSPLSAENWIASYHWQHQPTLSNVMRVSNYFCKWLDVEPMQIFPSDRFTTELSCDRRLPNGDGAWEAIVEEFEQEFGFAWRSNWTTVGDVVEAVDQRIA